MAENKRRKKTRTANSNRSGKKKTFRARSSSTRSAHKSSRRMAAKRSAAAKKGWETRRRHEREKKRKQRKRRIRRTQEWIIKTEYQPKQGGGKGGPAGRLVLTDIRVITPITWTREKVEQEIQRFAFGEKVKGLKVKAFDWARKEGAETKPTAAQVQDMGRFAAVFMDPETKFDIRKEKN